MADSNNEPRYTQCAYCGDVKGTERWHHQLLIEIAMPGYFRNVECMAREEAIRVLGFGRGFEEYWHSGNRFITNASHTHCPDCSKSVYSIDEMKQVENLVIRNSKIKAIEKFKGLIDIIKR